MPSHLGNVLLHGADLWSWITPPPTLNSTQRSENSTMRWKCNTTFHTNDFISKKINSLNILHMKESFTEN